MGFSRRIESVRFRGGRILAKRIKYRRDLRRRTVSKRDPTERNDDECLMMGGEMDEGAQSEALEPLSCPRRCGRMQVVEEAYL